jgi:NAD-dependent SIR2 family protein deacetylase
MKRVYIKIFEATCPHCGKRLDSSTAADDNGERAPEPRDPSICNKCAGVSVFTDDMQLAIPDREILDEWRAKPELWKAIDAAVETVKARNR